MEGPEPIAIIGIGCRLPGDISSASDCWEFLKAGRDARCEFPKDRFNIDGFYSSQQGIPGTLPMRGGYFLKQDIRHFDNDFFGVNNLEATYMDPQQRNLLEVVYECLESAGVRLENVAGANVGCYVGDFVTDYLVMQAKDDEATHRYSPTGKGRTLLSNRISHLFDFKGPSMTLDTACSSSLYCLHLACRALLDGDCDAAVVASANLIQTPEQQMDVCAARVLSPTSTCHTFDASADGYGRGDAVGALYLKRLSDAVKDNDPIRSIIRATATNSNGQTSGITLPSAQCQEAVMKKAYDFAGLSVTDTDYFECHGTGTPVGDPIEVAAVASFCNKTIQSNEERKLIIGSAKPTFGHSEAASGITSIIKATLALENLQIPATAGIQTLNPQIPWEDYGIRVAQALTPWPRTEPHHIPRISINSFGYGGANAHCILDQADAWLRRSQGAHQANDTTLFKQDTSIFPERDDEQNFILPFSASNAEALNQQLRNYQHLDLSAGDLSDLAYTLASRRSKFPWCKCIVARHSTWKDDFEQACNGDATHTADKDTAPITFVFSGQGAQWPQMGQRLFHAYSVFRDSILQLEYHLLRLRNSPDWSLSRVIFVDATAAIHEPAISQTACTAIHIALVDLLRSWNIVPEAVVGHSSGEIAAAYAAGHISATYAIEIAYLRGQVVSTNRELGSMIAVSMSADAAQELIEHHNLSSSVCIACYNSKENVTISGNESSINHLHDHIKAIGGFARKLKTGGQAYHSPHMKHLGPSYEHLLHEARNRDQEGKDKTARQHHSKVTSDILMISTVHARPVTHEDTADPAYWRTNLESPVLFSDAIERLSQDEPHTFIEIGPHHALQMPVQQIETISRHDKTKSRYFSALIRKKCSEMTALSLAGNLWTHGYNVDFEATRKGYRWHTISKPKVLHNLPNYPWDHSKILWNEPRVSIEYRQRKWPRDELIGSMIPGANGRTSTWRSLLNVANVPWIMDHKLGENIVLPGACYISMAIRACQQLSTHRPDTDILQLRDIHIEKVMLLEPGSQLEVFTELQPCRLSSINDYDSSWNFIISSFENGRSTRHAAGIVELLDSRTLVPVIDLTHSTQLEKQSSRLWYNQFKNKGLVFGPAFQSLSTLAIPRRRDAMYAEAEITALPADVTNEHEKRYPFDIHPVITDATFQTGLIATAKGSLEELNGRVPISIECLQIRTPQSQDRSDYRTRAIAKVVGPGSAIGQCELLDNAGLTIMQVKNIKVAPLQESDIPSSRRTPILLTRWTPDTSKINRRNVTQLSELLRHAPLSTTSVEPSKVLQIIEYQALIKPDLNILQIGAAQSLLSNSLISTITPYTREAISTYTIGVPGEVNMLCLDIADVKDLSEDDILTHGRPLHELSTLYDTIIVDDGNFADQSPIDTKILSRHLKASGLIISQTTFADDNASDSGICIDNVSLLSRADLCDDDSYVDIDRNSATIELSGVGKDDSIRISFSTSEAIAELSIPVLLVVDDLAHPLNQALADLVHDLHHESNAVLFTHLQSTDLEQFSTIVVTAELKHAIVANATEQQFSKIQLIANAQANVLWISGGSLISSKSPEHCAAFALSRSVMAGDPSKRFANLDIDNPQERVNCTMTNIRSILQSIDKPGSDLEYLQKDGVLHVSRLVHSDKYNEDFENKKIANIVLKKFSNIDTFELLISDPGQFDTLHFKQISTQEEISPDHVRISVKAVGMNAKDLYTLSGKVDTVDNTCSCEFSGIVTQLGSSVTGFSIGDRIVSSAPGRYRSTEIVPASVCYKLNDDEDFTELACVPMVYGTALHALRNLANLQRGESVLIHSAAGGVGTAAIRLAQQIGAEIYATVGNDNKKKYLVGHYGLKADQVFNSRDTSFLSTILKATNGTGVDVVLNSLTGTRLHASLDACAKFGRFIEIGKRDILDAGQLNMRVFEKGITFSAFDLHELYYSSNPRHRRTYEKLLIDAVELYRSLGYIASTTTTFDISDITSAFQYFANASRIGKVAITYDNPSSLVPFVPSKFSTRFSAEKSYLMVGCLGGLGRSISRYMLANGARHFTFLARTGATKPAAAALVSDLEHSGATVTVIRGDVCALSDVEKAVSSLTHPLGGVIQAAMSLSEALFPSMTHESWHTALHPKITGTWNLHHSISAHESTLDFFLLTSSIAGTIGFSTESNYCVANAFLDSFSSYRRSLGLKCSSVALGPVQGAGVVHENQSIENVFFRGGITEVSEDDMLLVIDIALSRQDEVGHLITGLEPEKAREGFQDAWEMLAPDPRLGGITARLKRHKAEKSAPNTTTATKTGLDPRLSTSSPSELSKTIHTILSEQLAKLLLMDADKISEGMYLTDVGMDSTLAAQFRTYIFRATGVDISFVLLMDAKTRMGSVVEVVREGLKER